MLLNKLFRYCRGFVALEAEGAYPERIINLCLDNNIEIWKIKNIKGKIFFATDRSNLIKIKNIRKKCGVKIRIKYKRGLPFYLKDNNNFLSFFLGAAFCLIIVTLLSQFVWNIEVAGNVSLTNEEVLDLCSKVNVYEGMPKKEVNSPNMRNDLLLLTDKIGWVSFNLEGSKLTVNVSETASPEISDNSPCNIIAKKDGVIKKTSVYKGSAVVTANTAVKKGDLLVSGTVEYGENLTNFVAAKAEITAETETVITVSTPFTITETFTKEKPIKKRVLTLYGLNIPLYFGTLKGNYNKTVDRHFIKKGTNYIPVYITTASFFEIIKTQRTISMDEAKTMLKNKAVDKEKEYKFIKIINSKDEFYEKDGNLVLNHTITAYEDIAEKELIRITD